MARKSLTRYGLRYTVVAGLPSGAALLALAAFAGVPPLLASLVLALGGGTLAALLVGATDAGIETAAAGAEAGFMVGSDAARYRPDAIPIPDRLAVVCWLAGVGLVGLGGLALLS